VVKVLCDFDGTIAVEDVTDGILSRFAPPKWLEIEQAWRFGQIGSRDCMYEQVALVRAELSAIDDYLDSVDIDPHFCQFVEYCEAQDIELRVVSDGIDYAIRRILQRHGLGHLPVIANALEQIGPDRYRLRFPFAAADCSAESGTCKCGIAKSVRRTATSREMTILVGDGASDFCGASAVDLVFAKDKLLAHCRARGLPHVRFANFGDAQALLADIVSEPLVLKGTL
jgi:2-hydroxy-3-keto-5-methylthiopentenyl-1-phosphate phosphatase